MIRPAGRERFHYIAWMGAGGPDTAVIFDFGASRVVSVDLRNGGTRGLTLPAMPDLIWPAVVGAFPSGRLLLLGNAMPSPGAGGINISQDSSQLFTLSLHTERLSPYGKRVLVRPTHHVAGFSTTLPWEAVATFAVLGDRMLRSSGADSVVELQDSTGVVRAKIVLPLAASRVDPKDADAALSGAETVGLPGSAEALRRVMASTTLPPRSPYLTAIKPASESTFWARGWAMGPEVAAHWVFEATDGRLIDSLKLPPNIDLMAASGRRLLIQWKGSQTWLSLYELTTSP